MKCVHVRQVILYLYSILGCQQNGIHLGSWLIVTQMLIENMIFPLVKKCLKCPQRQIHCVRCSHSDKKKKKVEYIGLEKMRQYGSRNVLCIDMQQVGISVTIDNLTIITQEATIKINMVEPTWAVCIMYIAPVRTTRSLAYLIGSLRVPVPYILPVLENMKPYIFHYK